jgi:hypothetical protein
MTIYVEDCGNCPCLYQNSEFPESFCKINNRRFFPAYEKGGPAPDWCPLKGGSITLELKERETTLRHRQPKRKP